MNPAGYSGKPLIQKLGYQSGQSVLAINAPDWFTEYLHQENIFLAETLPVSWAHYFVTKQTELAALLKKFPLDKIEKGLWISWPKKASKVSTDITEQTLRDLILLIGWVDVKVAAVDETWSGLKFLSRKTNRGR